MKISYRGYIGIIFPLKSSGLVYAAVRGSGASSEIETLFQGLGWGSLMHCMTDSTKTYAAVPSA